MINIKNSLTIIFAILFYGSLSAQDCTVTNLVLSSQAQIDNFAITYPGCTDFDGSITISDTDATPITNLNGLSQIETVKGDLLISGNDQLTNLEGLTNLRQMDEYSNIQIINNASLISLSGLKSLTRIPQDGSVHIINNASLLSLSGLDSLTSTGEDAYIEIADNPSLINLNGLNNLVEIEGDIYIRNNSALTNLMGLENLVMVEKLYIENNESLSTLTGLADFNAIDFQIVNNASLVNLSGLNFNKIDDESLIMNNPNLVVCNSESICNYLTQLTSFDNLSLQMIDNASGCNTAQEVLNACTTTNVETTKPSNTFSVFPIPANDNIQVQFDSEQRAIEISILNLIGEIIHSKNINVLANTPVSFDVSNYAPGVYFMRIFEGKDTVTKRFVKQ